MSARANGYFEAFVNSRAYSASAEDRALIAKITDVCRTVLAATEVHWAGSQRKGTAIRGSDLDLCVLSRDPVTEAQRRDLRSALEIGLGRPARILSHAIRLPTQGGRPKVDVAFANAAFGSRPPPDPSEFHDQRSRQAAARAFKIAFRAGNLPPTPGWVVEALVVHLDQGAPEAAPLDLFVRILAWLDERASPAAVESVLRPAAFPRWSPEWSARLPGRIEAVRNHARAIRKRGPSAETWRGADDVARWLLGENVGSAAASPRGES